MPMVCYSLFQYEYLNTNCMIKNRKHVYGHQDAGIYKNNDKIRKYL